MAKDNLDQKTTLLLNPLFTNQNTAIHYLSLFNYSITQGVTTKTTFSHCHRWSLHQGSTVFIE